MAKQTGFFVNARYFVPLDKKDFAKQRDAYAMMAAIEQDQKLSAEFIEAATLVGVTVKPGGYDAGAPVDEQIDTLGGAIDGKRGRKAATE